ncbi:MAG: hypothetical protein WDZ85_03505 [Candidatus Paceibacterota bacterium]
MKIDSQKLNRYVSELFKEVSSSVDIWLVWNPSWRRQVELFNLQDYYSEISRKEDGPFISCVFWIEPTGKNDRREIISRGDIFDEREKRFRISSKVRLTEEDRIPVAQLMGEFLIWDEILGVTRVSGQYPPAELYYLIFIKDWTRFTK